MSTLSQGEPFEKWPELLDSADVEFFTGLPRDDVYQMFKQKDFPALIPEKRRGKVIGRYALRAYLNRGVPIDEN